MSEETTTEMLAEIEGQPEPQPVHQQAMIDSQAETIAGLHSEIHGLNMQNAELQAQVAFLKNRELTLGTRLQDEKAVSTKRLEQIQELRSEVSHVQGLLGEEKLQNVRLETLVGDLRAVNAAQEKAVNSATRDKADLESRLRAVAAEFGVQLETNNRLQTQLEAVKAELVRQCENSRLLQIELDAREQVPQAVSDRFEEGWDAGTARAVETIAEWLEPIKAAMDAADNQDELARAGFFAIDTIRHLPVIMRSLTGLTDED